MGGEQVDASLLLELLQEFLLLLRPEVIIVLGLSATHATLLLELHLKLATLLLISRVRHNAAPPEVIEHLAWDLFERLLGQHHRVVLEVPEGHKLNDVGGHLLAIALGVERLFISIELVHGAEVG